MVLTKKIIAVFGGSVCTPQEYSQAVKVGELIAVSHGILVCGGLSGIMEAVCKGAKEKRGVTVGILPGDDVSSANKYVQIPIATGMGIGRNIIIARSAQVCIAIAGKYGTLSEIAYALQLEKPVITLNSWDQIPGTIQASSPKEAVDLAFSKT
jgi:uncharacterized protein (TIGR00725 family)